MNRRNYFSGYDEARENLNLQRLYHFILQIRLFRWHLIGSLFLFIVLSNTVYPQSTYVPLNHRVYEFIERMETKQIIGGVLGNTKPMTRSQIAGYILQIQKKVDAGLKLNTVEQQQLNFLNIEYREELHQTGYHLKDYTTRLEKIRNNKYINKILPDFIYANNRNFLSWEKDDFRVYFDPILNHQRTYSSSDTLRNTGKTFHNTNGARIYGQLGDRLGFFIDARDNKEWGTKTYRLGNYTLPGLGFVRATSPDFIYHDETDAYIKLGFKYIDLVYGKFKNYWGPGQSGSLILSDQATSYDQFKLDVLYKRFKFTSIYAFLIDYQDFKGDSLQQRKYMAAHRLEFSPWNWLTIGMSEVVVFKSREFEPSYLNPVMFYRSAEHFLGSPDNVMMALDFKALPVKNLKLYGELLLDDVTSSKLGTDYFGNKWGILTGIFFADFLTLDNFDLRCEYVKLRPYVYSHDNSLSHTHYATSLGHAIGPNSDALITKLNYRFSRFLKCGLEYSKIRHGANDGQKNNGGDIDRYFRPQDSIDAPFLGGVREATQVIGADVRYEVFRNLFLESKLLWENYQKAEQSTVGQTTFYFSVGINY